LLTEFTLSLWVLVDQHSLYCRIWNIIHCYGTYNPADGDMDLWGKRERMFKGPIKNVERKDLNTHINITIISMVFLLDEATASAGLKYQTNVICKARTRKYAVIKIRMHRVKGIC
jgi:hypothetical protein